MRLVAVSARFAASSPILWETQKKKHSGEGPRQRVHARPVLIKVQVGRSQPLNGEMLQPVVYRGTMSMFYRFFSSVGYIADLFVFLSYIVDPSSVPIE